MIAFLLRVALCALCFACAYHAACCVCMRMRLVAGARRKLSLEDVLRDRMLCFALFAACAAVLSTALSLWLLPPALVLAYVLARRAPRVLDARAAKRLHSDCDEHVDMMADLVAMGVSSGLSFDASLALYCDKFDNVLSRELEGARITWTSGLASRHDALTELSERVGSKALKRFSDTSLQAIQRGSPLVEMLGRFSSDVRQRRRSAIERQIEKAPVKMLVPTGTCILPAMLILVMGPVILQFVQTGM